MQMHPLNKVQRLPNLVALTLILVPLILLSNFSMALAAIVPSITDTPVKHLIVIFQENVSFDHYFATYPYAINTVGEPHFSPSVDTPTINGLTTTGLLTN